MPGYHADERPKDTTPSSKHSSARKFMERRSELYTIDLYRIVFEELTLGSHWLLGGIAFPQNSEQAATKQKIFSLPTLSLTGTGRDSIRRSSVLPSLAVKACRRHRRLMRPSLPTRRTSLVGNGRHAEQLQ